MICREKDGMTSIESGKQDGGILMIEGPNDQKISTNQNC